jgi:sulfur carrier protein
MRHHGAVLVRLRNPSREIDLAGPMTVAKLMSKLDLNREAVLVVRNDALVPGDATLADEDVVEIRPVISGGSW